MARLRSLKIAIAGVLAGTLLSGTNAAVAEDAGIPGSLSGNVALTSEYYFRGLSQTDDAPALQGGMDYEVPLADEVSLYLGAWGSNVDFNEAAGVDGATLEVDFYGGLSGNLNTSGISWDVGFIYYAYPGAASALDYDFWEAQAALGYDFGFAEVTASLNFSPENFGKSGNAYYPKLAIGIPIPGIKGLSVSAHIAKQYIERNAVFGSPDYVEWNIGVTYNVLGFDVSLNYSDTDISPAGDGNSEAVLLTIGRSF